MYVYWNNIGQTGIHWNIGGNGMYKVFQLITGISDPRRFCNNIF